MRRDRLQALAPYARHLPLACNLLLVLLIAASLARMAWLLYPLPKDRFDLPPPAPLPTHSGALPKVNLEQIAAANLFGQRQATGTAAPVDAPETALNLKLKGILAFGSETASRALIADASGREKPYAVGDDVPGGAVLKAIHADRVILERSGRFETLRLERNKSGGSAAANYSPPAVAPTATAGGTGGEATTLAELRNELLREPGKASQYVRLQPVYSDGKLQGYRLYPGVNRALFQQVGLRAGEMVTSVNGVQLDDAAKALQLLGDLREVSELTLTLDRGGETRTLNLNLNQ
ncbi:MAG TPA: type II secretion system protein GspC [Nevskiales bacterium]|nr:type II secretion system protein GspC [Nevskiales bacterium]